MVFHTFCLGPGPGEVGNVAPLTKESGREEPVKEGQVSGFKF